MRKHLRIISERLYVIIPISLSLVELFPIAGVQMVLRVIPKDEYPLWKQSTHIKQPPYYLNTKDVTAMLFVRLSVIFSVVWHCNYLLWLLLMLLL